MKKSIGSIAALSLLASLAGAAWADEGEKKAIHDQAPVAADVAKPAAQDKAPDAVKPVAQEHAPAAAAAPAQVQGGAAGPTDVKAEKKVKKSKKRTAKKKATMKKVEDAADTAKDSN